MSVKYIEEDDQKWIEFGHTEENAPLIIVDVDGFSNYGIFVDSGHLTWEQVDALIEALTLAKAKWQKKNG